MEVSSTHNAARFMINVDDVVTPMTSEVRAGNATLDAFNGLQIHGAWTQRLDNPRDYQENINVFSHVIFIWMFCMI